MISTNILLENTVDWDQYFNIIKVLAMGGWLHGPMYIDYQQKYTCIISPSYINFIYLLFVFCGGGGFPVIKKLMHKF